MLRIEKKKISELTGLPLNPRKSSESLEKEIQKSIHRFGLVSPLIWNEKTGHLIGGHQRLKVLRGEGKEEVEVVVLSLSPEEERALNIALNEIRGEWDASKLKDVLQSLSPELRNYSGFTPDELAQLFEGFPEVELEIKEPEGIVAQLTFADEKEKEKFEEIAEEEGWEIL